MSGGDPEASPINGLPPPKHTRWKPGQSANPKGINGYTKITVTDRIERMLHEEDGKEAEDVARLKLESVKKQLKSGKDDGFEKLIDRLEGPIKQILDQTNREGRAEEMDDTELAQALSQLIGGGDKTEPEPKPAKKTGKKKAAKKKTTRKRPPKTDE